MCSSDLLPPGVLAKASRSTSIDVSANDALVLAANPENDSVSLFTASGTALTRVGTPLSMGAGSQPVSVVIHPDNVTAFVVLRKTQRLVKVNAINTVTPTVFATTATVGSEPTGVALSPSGKYAVVTNFGDDTVTVVDTATMAVLGTTVVGPNPRAVAISNDFDADDDDEKAYVTLFYGAVNANGEVRDNGRTGKVIEVNLMNRTKGATIDLAPITDSAYGSFVAADGGVDKTATAGCAPNQLSGIAITQGKGYVVHTCASPQGPVNPLTNVQAAISVFTLSTGLEDTSPAGTASLNRLMRTQDADGVTTVSTFPGVPWAIDFKLVAGQPSSVAYVASMAADLVQRVQYSATGIMRSGNTYNILLGTQTAFGQIDIRAGVTKVPNGIATSHVNNVAYVNNWVDRSVTVIDLNTQTALTAVRSDELPNPTNQADALKVHNGRKFYFTGTGRWALRGVSSCGACHPDGLSDNITWAFAAGPRQTTPMDGTYSKKQATPAAERQRALNWTAIFDEIHDFENNTRGTSGGKGAIVTGAPPNDARIDLAARAAADGGVLNTSEHTNLAGSTKAVVKFKSSLPDWDEVDEFSKTIRANRRPSTLVAGDVTAGAALFTQGNCHACHGGDKWTVSRTPYAPDVDPDRTGASSMPQTGYRTQATSPGTLTSVPSGAAVNPESNAVGFRVSVERGTEQDGGVVTPERITCVLRKVGTFVQADPLERKANAASNAQGATGFNPPSLLGLATSAPYLHHGKAKTLNEVLTDSAWSQHLVSGNPNFTLTAQQATQLAAYLLSIDDDTTVVAPPAGSDICTGY